MKVNNYNDHNLVTFSNSLLRHFGVEPFHQTEQIIDEALGNHKKVVVILFDGMGQNIIRKHLKYNSFIRQHYLCTINSTFPPTTTAATTAFLTGKYPIETGWMAWSQFFEKYNRNIVPFTNKDYNTKEKLSPQNIAFNEMPIRSILELIQEKNPQMHTFNVKRYPIDMDGPKTLGDLRRKIKKSLKGVKKCLGYFYYDEPDGLMHHYGINNWRVHHKVRQINKTINKICKDNPDTLFITFADHGHINAKYLDICEHEDIYSLLRHPISFEKRTPTFFVEEGKEQEFKDLFNKYYGKHFSLLSKKEALDSCIFGEGHINQKACDFIGDFVATSLDEYGLYASKEFDIPELYKGNHAGNTSEEMLIDVSLYNA